MSGKQNKVIEPCACVYPYVYMCKHMVCLSGTRLSSAHDRNIQKTWRTCTQYDQPRGGRMSGVRTGTGTSGIPGAGMQHLEAVGLQVGLGWLAQLMELSLSGGSGHCDKLQPSRPKHGRWGEIP